jgi:hypothetical protein
MKIRKGQPSTWMILFSRAQDEMETRHARPLNQQSLSIYFGGDMGKKGRSYGLTLILVVAAERAAGAATTEVLRTSDVPSPLVCHKLNEEAQRLKVNREDEWMLLQSAERALEMDSGDVAEDLAACYKWLGDEYRDRGSYRAEKLYLKAVELAPVHPEVLESIAQYYRNFRGSKGLFAEAEYYYLRAEDALVAALQKVEDLVDQDYLLDVRERVIRGRIELNKREGLGLVIPHDQDRRFGLYLGFESETGSFPVAHNDLATPALVLLGIDRGFDPRQMIRSQGLERQRARLRFRPGKYPYWDLAWSSIDGTNVITGQFLPVTFFDIDIDEVEVAIENAVGKAPYGDLLWRVEIRKGSFDVVNLFLEESERLNASITLTRNFGRFKTDLELVGSAASIDTDGRIDLDLLAAVNLRMVHFRPHIATNLRTIDPRGYEYVAGYVTRQREFGESVELVQETLYAGVKLRDLFQRTDLQILSNFFRNTVRGKGGEDSSNLEANLILTHRIIDLVNNLVRRQSSRPVGLAQWALNLRLFKDFTVSTVSDFESRGLVLGSFVEVFSGPSNRSTVVVEGNYEVREYPHLARREEMLRVSFKLGF